MYPKLNIRLILEIAGVLAILSLVGIAHCSGVKEGQAKAESQQLKQAMKPLQKRADSLLKAAHSTDSILKAREKTRLVVREKYRVVHDSLYSVDTVEVPQIVELADSALEAADSVISAQSVQIVQLKSLVAVRDSQIANLNAQVRQALKSKPSRLSRIASDVKWIGVGAAGLAIWKAR